MNEQKEIYKCTINPTIWVSNSKLSSSKEYARRRNKAKISDRITGNLASGNYTIGGSSCPRFRDRFGIWNLVYVEEGEPEDLEKNPSEQGQKRTKNSTHTVMLGLGTQATVALSPLRHLCYHTDLSFKIEISRFDNFQFCATMHRSFHHS